jgi:hypothetical protein
MPSSTRQRIAGADLRPSVRPVVRRGNISKGLHCQSATSRVFDDKDVFQNVSKGICVYLAAQTMSVPILTVTLSGKLELHWSTKL